MTRTYSPLGSSVSNSASNLDIVDFSALSCFFVSSLLVNATESFVKLLTSAVKQKIDEENRIEYEKRSEEERKQKIEEEKIKAKQEAERKIKEEKAEARHQKRKTFR